MDTALAEAGTNARLNKERWDNRHNHVYGRAPRTEAKPDPKGKGKAPVENVTAVDEATDDDRDVYDTVVSKSIGNLQKASRVVSRFSEVEDDGSFLH